MKQVVVIHGGDTFENYEEYLNFLRKYQTDFSRLSSDRSDWKPWLRQALGPDYEVALPSMPNKFNARYAEWQLWFEKLFPFLNDGVILIGHSMGGAFLAKYLTENKFPKKLHAIFLVAAVYDKDTDGNPLHTFALPEKIELPTDKIFLYHSKDDQVVPFSDLEKYHQILSNATVRVFEDRGHFNQAEFLEIVSDIKSLF